MNEIKIHKFWWGWECKKIECWLEQMESKGMELKKITGNGTDFYFEETNKPRKMSYCIDYQNKLTDEYKQLTKEDGWEMLDIKMGWLILKKEYDEEKPEFYTDYNSLIQRNNRILVIFALLFLAIASQVPNLINTYILPSKHSIMFPLRISCIILYILIIGFYMLALGKLLHVNYVLSKQKKMQNK